MKKLLWKTECFGQQHHKRNNLEVILVYSDVMYLNALSSDEI